MPNVCAKCSAPLQLTFDPDSDSDADMAEGEASSSQNPAAATTYPDDVTLSCLCHFHWECLLEAYELDKCPACTTTVVSGNSDSPQIIVDLNNEGGLQEGLDIFPILKEESYLRAYPEERKCRVFLEFCREGDHRAIAGLLQSCTDDSDEPSKSPDEILRYQDTMGDMQSGLHAAAANGHREVAWMLLLLASQYPEMEFPPLVFQEAAYLGLMREEQEGMVDIRTLRDDQGRTPEDLAREVGVIWTGWIGNGRLAMP